MKKIIFILFFFKRSPKRILRSGKNSCHNVVFGVLFQTKKMAVIRTFFFIYSFLILSCGQNSIPFSDTNQKEKPEHTHVFAKTGDIVFQNSQSSQCKAIELATHSRYTHCGIIFVKEGKSYVLEAVQPVKYTPIENWIERGFNKQFVVKRLKNPSILSDSIINNMIEECDKYLGKDYDIYFEWSDEKIYCSELVWKIYKNITGLEIGQLHKLKDFDLTSDEVKRTMKKRYGDNIPFEELVISPSTIFDSSLLETITEN